MGMFNSAGIMWSPELVGWGSKGGVPTLEIVGYYPKKLGEGKGALSKSQRERQTLNAWSQPAVYGLYKADRLIYVGQAKRLGDRLLAHHRDDGLVGRWDAFSWVSSSDIKEVVAGGATTLEWQPAQAVPQSSSPEGWLNEIEALGILLGRPTDNGQYPGFGKHTWFLVQLRSQYAAVSHEEMIRALYEKLVP